MNRPDLFNETSQIMIRAYLNDTLVSGECAACLMGNLIAHRKGYGIRTIKFQVEFDADGCCAFDPISRTSARWFRPDFPSDLTPNPKWVNVFSTFRGVQTIYNPIAPWGVSKNYLAGIGELSLLGYELPELLRLEFAFESAVKKERHEDETDEMIATRLFAAMDVLLDIHEVHEQEQVFYKGAFVEALVK